MSTTTILSQSINQLPNDYVQPHPLTSASHSRVKNIHNFLPITAPNKVQQTNPAVSQVLPLVEYQPDTPLPHLTSEYQYSLISVSKAPRATHNVKQAKRLALSA